MQSLAGTSSSSLGWQDSSRQGALRVSIRIYARRRQAPTSCYTVKQASQSSSGSASSSQNKAQARRDASDTLRSLESILGSTDDTDVKQDGPSQSASSSSSSSSLSAFTATLQAEGLSSSRQQGSISQGSQRPSLSSGWAWRSQPEYPILNTITVD